MNKIIYKNEKRDFKLSLQLRKDLRRNFLKTIEIILYFLYN